MILRRGPNVKGRHREIADYVAEYVTLKDQLELMPAHLLDTITQDAELIAWLVINMWIGRYSETEIEDRRLYRACKLCHLALVVESLRRRGYVRVIWPSSVFVDDMNELRATLTESGRRAKREGNQ